MGRASAPDPVPWDTPAPPSQPLPEGLGNVSPAAPGDVTPRSNSRPRDPGIIATTAASVPPLPQLDLSLECIPARDTRKTSRESKSHYPPVEHHDVAAIAALLAALPNSVSIWQKVKQALVSGDCKGEELIDVLMLGAWEPEDRTVAIYPIIRGNQTTPDKYILFQWPVLSELCQLVAKCSLGSTPNANML